MPHFEEVEVPRTDQLGLPEAAQRLLLKIVEQVNLIPYAFHRLEDKVAQAKTHSQQTATEVHTINRQLQGMEDRSSQGVEMNGRVAGDYDDRIRNLTQRLEQQHQFLIELSERMDSDDRRRNKEFGSVNEKLRKQKESLDKAEHDVSVLRRMLDTHHERFEQLSALMDNQYKNVQHVMSRLSTKQEVANVSKKHDFERHQLQVQLVNRIDALQSEMMKKIDAAKAEAAERHTQMKEKYEALQDEVHTKLKTDFTAVKTEVNGLHKHVDTLSRLVQEDQDKRNELIRSELRGEVAKQINEKVAIIDDQSKQLINTISEIESRLHLSISTISSKVHTFDINVCEMNEQYPKLMAELLDQQQGLKDECIETIRDLFMSNVKETLTGMAEQLDMLESAMKKSLTKYPATPARLTEARFFALEERVRLVESESGYSSPPSRARQHSRGSEDAERSLFRSNGAGLYGGGGESPDAYTEVRDLRNGREVSSSSFSGNEKSRGGYQRSAPAPIDTRFDRASNAEREREREKGPSKDDADSHQVIERRRRAATPTDPNANFYKLTDDTDPSKSKKKSSGSSKKKLTAIINAAPVHSSSSLHNTATGSHSKGDPSTTPTVLPQHHHHSQQRNSPATAATATTSAAASAVAKMQGSPSAGSQGRGWANSPQQHDKVAAFRKISPPPRSPMIRPSSSTDVNRTGVEFGLSIGSMSRLPLYEHGGRPPSSMEPLPRSSTSLGLSNSEGSEFLSNQMRDLAHLKSRSASRSGSRGKTRKKKSKKRAT